MKNYFISSKNVNEYEIVEDIDSIITCFKYLKINGIWRLVVCLNNCFKIYSEDGHNLITHLKLTIPSNRKKQIDSSEIIHYFSAISSLNFENLDYLVITNTLGEIFLAENPKENIFNIFLAHHLKNLTIPISDIISFEKNLILSDNIGKLSIFNILNPKTIVLKKERDSQSENTPITNILILTLKNSRNFIVTGDFLGRIKLFHLEDLELILELNSHTRVITSLDLKKDSKNTAPEIMSCSEDGYLNIWKIEEKDEKQVVSADLKISFRIADQMIVGGKFMGNKGGSAISIYDSNEISIINYEKS